MASLQKIRNHGALLIVIVGVAMLAFILGDFLRDGSSLIHRDRDKVGIVAGEALSYAEYEAEIKRIESFYPDAQKAEIHSQIRDQVWNNFLQEHLFRTQAEKIGMIVKADRIGEDEAAELTELFLGANPHHYIKENPSLLDANGDVNREGIIQLINSLNDADPEMLQNPEYVQQVASWMNLEKTVRNMYLQEKYYTLLQSLVRVNSLEAEFSFNNRQHGVSAEFVMQPYYAIADSLVKVSESDIKKLYKQNLYRYKQEPTRTIKYVSFAKTPSAEDFEAAKAAMERVQDEFRTTDDVMLVVQQHSETVYDGRDYSQENVPAQFKDFAFAKGAKAGDCTDLLFDGETYAMARIIKAGYSLPDSVELKAIIEGGEDREIGWVTEEQLIRGNAPKALIEKAFAGKRGTQFTIPVGMGEMTYEIMEVSKATPKVKLAILSRTVIASSKTESAIYNNASTFVVDHNNTESFEAGAQENGWVVTPQYGLKALTENVGNIKDSRQIVRWAFEAKEGEVSSTVYDCGDQYIIATLTDVNEEEYRPLEMVRGELTYLATNKAKYEYVAGLIKNATSLEEVAEILGQPIQSTERVALSDYRFANTGFEPAVIGATLALDENQLSEAIQGNTGVFVVKAGAANNSTDEFQPALEKMQLGYSSSQQHVGPAMRLIESEAEITDNRANFQ